MAGRTFGRSLGRVIPSTPHPFSTALSEDPEAAGSQQMRARNPFQVARGTPAQQATPQSQSPSLLPEGPPVARPQRQPPSGMVPQAPQAFPAMDILPSSGDVSGPTGQLGDRFSAVQDGIASGEMDPQGANYTTFGPHVGMGSTPIARFLDAVESAGTQAQGNIDVTRRPVVNNSNGTISTERSIDVSLGQNGKAILGGPEDNPRVLIPTVVDGRIVSDQEAVDNYNKTGQHLGIFKNSKDAGDYAIKLHNQQDQRYSPSPSSNVDLPSSGPLLEGLTRVPINPENWKRMLEESPDGNVEDRTKEPLPQPAPDEEDLRKLNENIRTFQLGENNPPLTKPSPAMTGDVGPHNPNWFGYKRYPEIFDAVEKNPTGRFRLRDGPSREPIDRNLPVLGKPREVES